MTISVSGTPNQNPLYPTNSPTSPGSAAQTGFIAEERAGSSVIDLTANAAISLNSDTSGITASTQAGNLALEFDKLLQSATSVDPATGHREIIQGAGDKLTASVNKLLTDNGFSAEEAQAATSNLSQELAQGGKITLSASHQSADSSNQLENNSLLYGQYSVLKHQEVQTVSNTVNLSIDLDSGQLSVALKGHKTDAGQDESLINSSDASHLIQDNANISVLPSGGGFDSGETSVAGTAGSPLTESQTRTASQDYEVSEQITNSTTGQTVLKTGSVVNGVSSQKQTKADSGLANSSEFSDVQAVLASDIGNFPSAAAPSAQATSTDSAKGNAAPATAPETALQRLIDNLTDPKIFKLDQAAELVQQLSKVADNVKTQVKASADALDQKLQAEKANQKPGTSPSQSLQDLQSHLEEAQKIYGGLTDNAAPQGAQKSVSAQIQISQRVSISKTTDGGSNETAFARPDGTTGKISLSPVQVTA